MKLNDTTQGVWLIPEDVDDEVIIKWLRESFQMKHGVKREELKLPTRAS